MRMIRRREAELPTEVVAVVEAASITVRSSHGDDAARAFVALGGSMRGMFLFSSDEAEQRIRARWPWLSDQQVRRTTNYLKARVRLALKPIHPTRKSWIFDY